MLNEAPRQPSAIAFPGNGEMVRAVNSKDWGKTLLGPQEQWPGAIRSAVALCLNSQFQIERDHAQIVPA